MWFLAIYLKVIFVYGNCALSTNLLYVKGIETRARLALCLVGSIDPANQINA